MTANIRIDAVEITPNPASTGARFLIAVTITDILAGILTAAGDYIETADGLCLVREGG